MPDLVLWQSRTVLRFKSNILKINVEETEEGKIKKGTMPSSGEYGFKSNLNPYLNSLCGFNLPDLIGFVKKGKSLKYERRVLHRT